MGVSQIQTHRYTQESVTSPKSSFSPVFSFQGSSERNCYNFTLDHLNQPFTNTVPRYAFMITVALGDPYQQRLQSAGRHTHDNDKGQFKTLTYWSSSKTLISWHHGMTGSGVLYYINCYRLVTKGQRQTGHNWWHHTKWRSKDIKAFIIMSSQWHAGIITKVLF